jgi:hypothetical protein
MEEVYQQTFNVRTIMVLIRHHHNATIPECSHLLLSLILERRIKANDLD